MEVPTMESTVVLNEKKVALTEEQSNNWSHGDIETDTIPGISLDKAYKFLEGKEGVEVIVGVIDSGIDIGHEDLKDVLWVNTDEIPGNGIDDDKNGYVDDVHGWNYLGGNGVAAPEQLEITRIVAKLNPIYEGKTEETISEEEKVGFKKYQDFIKSYESSSKNYFQTMERLVQIGEHFAVAKGLLGGDSITLESLKGIETEDELIKAQVGDIIALYERGIDYDAYSDYYESQKKSKHYDLEFDGRAIVGDKPEDIGDLDYGNGNVTGSLAYESHGTHVAGIILADRSNDIGIKGVADNAKLMSVRAVPDGDERDKDIALAIRYAVDNGAKVVNMSFGKSFSPHRHWVFEAIKYAAEKDVLLVHAAGNSNKDIDVKDNWPNDSVDKVVEISDNVLTIGAMSSNINQQMPAGFSNYGKLNVDLFAPGVQIYSTIPENKYGKFNGTSMAAPAVAGIATLVRSYYPKLSASQVKHIIMNSGVRIELDVAIPGKDGETGNFSTLSVSGSIANAYNALLLADKMVNSK
jgi:subtilisin family serine protease